MGRDFGILVLGFCLAGCVTNAVDRGLDRLVGQDIHAAVSQLGAFDGQPTITGGDKNYVWTTKKDITAEIKSAQMSGAAVNNRPIYETVTNMDTVHLNCTIQLVTDQSDRIKSYKWSGDNYCQQYFVHMLKSSAGPGCKADSSPRMGNICD